MIPQNVVNSQKKGNIQGYTFHLFYPDLHTSILFDRDLTEPIVWGSKNIVMTALKNIDKIMEVSPEIKVRIYSYIMTHIGYRRVHTYDGPIETIGKYILRI